MNVIDHVEAAGKAPSGNRKAIRAGNHEVSVQASGFHYCQPRVTGLPLNEYSAVEIALWPANKELQWSTPGNTSFLKPYSDLWGGDDVAAYVPWETVQAIVDAACDAATTECSDTNP